MGIIVHLPLARGPSVDKVIVLLPSGRWVCLAGIVFQKDARDICEIAGFPRQPRFQDATVGVFLRTEAVATPDFGELWESWPDEPKIIAFE